MTLYYNPTYSSSPYHKAASDVEFGNIYCGDVQLLQRLLFYAGVPYLPATTEERVAHLTNIDSDFYAGKYNGQLALYEEAIKRSGSIVRDRLICYLSLGVIIKMNQN